MGMEVGKKWQQEQKRAQPSPSTSVSLNQSEHFNAKAPFRQKLFISIPTPFSAFPLTRMKQMCHLLLLFLALGLGILHSAYATRCYSCASPILRGDWQATGFPQYPPTIFTKPRAGDADAKEEPKQFAFTDKCDERGTTKLPLSECPGLCIEMVLATNGIYAIVRGCLDDFYPLDQPPATGEPGCFRSTTNQNVSIADKGGSNAEAMISVPQVTVGANICQTRETTKICNEQLAANSYFAKGVTSPSMATGWLSEVVAGYNPCFKSSGAVQCLKCARVDMEGTCDWNVRDYCNGAWCTKTIGYINGRWLEVRGCSSVNPLNTQSCSKLELDTQTSMIGDYQIPKHTSLEQCFCNNQRCNGAVRMLGLLGGGGGLPLILLLALVPAILLTMSSGGNSNFMMYA